MRKESNIAVIMVNYNGAKDTVECLRSIQKSKIVVDAIVVDNASEGDDGEKIAREFPDAKVIISTENLGYAGGTNLGIRYALNKKYEYITLLNNDTIVDKNMFIELQRVANKNLVVLPVMYYYDLPQKIWYAGGIINKHTGVVKHIEQIAYTQEDRYYCEFATGCCMMLHHNIIEKIGMLDERFFMYCEDEEYSLRLTKHNISIAVIPTAKLWHKIAQSSGKNSRFFEYYNSRNRMLCIRKYNDFFCWSAYIYSVITRVIKMFRYLVKKDEKYKSYMYAIVDASKELYIRRY